MTKYPNGLDAVTFCDRCKHEIAAGRERTHNYQNGRGEIVHEDICCDCYDKMYRHIHGPHMKLCRGCKSIQVANTRCGVCGGDTGE